MAGGPTRKTMQAALSKAGRKATGTNDELERRYKALLKSKTKKDGKKTNKAKASKKKTGKKVKKARRGQVIDEMSEVKGEPETSRALNVKFKLFPENEGRKILLSEGEQKFAERVQNLLEKDHKDVAVIAVPRFLQENLERDDMVIRFRTTDIDDIPRKIRVSGKQLVALAAIDDGGNLRRRFLQ